MLQQIVKGSQQGADRIKVQSALNPLLWLCAIAIPMCFAAAYLFYRANAPIGLCCVLIASGIMPILVACGTYIAFAARSRESLQSEAYQLQHEALRLIEKSGTPLKIAPVSIEAITTLTAGQRSGS